MTCIRCKHDTAKRFGYYGKRHIQRFRCRSCRLTFAAPHASFGAHYTTPETAAKVLSLMLEGMSVRAISRLTGLHQQTILALMNTAATTAHRVFDTQVRGIRPRFVQLDELWCMVGCHGRTKTRTKPMPAEWGDQWVWLALDSESKMILSYHWSVAELAGAA